jgi:cellulose synthase/poly-beta-1,6-N-acetylglucosamine synthase-like glycosyltransferase
MVMTDSKNIEQQRSTEANSDKGDINNDPLVSIIVPVYNASATLDRCLTALLSQEYPSEKVEIIVVDNNSTDNTADIIRSYPVLYLKEAEIQSSYAARNKGVKHSISRLLAFTDSDCVPHPQWLKEGINGFKDAKIGAVAGEITSAKPTSLVESYLQYSEFLSPKICMNHPFLSFIQTANAFYRREVFDEIGYFDETMISGGDADFAWRMQIKTSFKITYRPSAIVIHKHRSNLKDFFKQRFTHGIGKANFEHKYSRHIREKQIVVDSQKSIFYFLLRLVALSIFGILRGFFFLITFRCQLATYELIAWYGRVGNIIGFMKQRKQIKAKIKSKRVM